MYVQIREGKDGKTHIALVGDNNEVVLVGEVLEGGISAAKRIAKRIMNDPPMKIVVQKKGK